MSSPMSSPSTNKRRNVVSPKSAEKSALNLIAEEADSREAKSQEVLTEARKIRCSERLKDKEENGDEEEELVENGHDSLQQKNSQPIKPIPISAMAEEQDMDKNSMLQSASASQEETQERFKRSMLVNAQLDNECRMLRYQTDLLKDEVETSNEAGIQLNQKIRRLQHDKNIMDLDLEDLRYQLQQLHHNIQKKDNIIKEHGFSMVTVGTPSMNGNNNSGDSSCDILSASQLDLLSEYTGSLGNRLQQLFEEKNATLEMNKKLNKDLDEARNTIISTPNPPSSSSTSSSPSLLAENTNPLENKQNLFIETKYKLKKAEQEITTLQGSVTRLETQLTRYKNSSDSLEKQEEELKADKRRLQIELRDCKGEMEEIQTKNNHLIKRVEKMKVNRIQEALQ